MTLLFACACGAATASIYYTQPLLVAIAQAFHRTPASLGFLVTATQLGYALALLTLVPLGDVLDRRKLIVCLMALNAVVLGLIAVSTNYWVFLGANVCLGVTTASAQLLIPFAASLATEEKRGQVVGTVMSGLLTGVLLARTVSGGIAQASGWRAVFVVAALAMFLLTIVLFRALPDDRREGRVNYGALMVSLATLARGNPALLVRSLYGAMVFLCFNLVWTGLTFLLTRHPYNYSEGQIGLFGIVGSAGMVSATFAGRLFDRGHGEAATGAFACAVLASFGLVAMGGHSLTALLAGIVLLDIGVYGVHISNQSVIFSLAGNARSRVNTIYLTSFFIGAAAGSSIASVVFERAGWSGVCVAGALCAGVLVALWGGAQWLRSSHTAQGKAANF
jgi:predicted MFS family arabinose efflux permease